MDDKIKLQTIKNLLAKDELVIPISVFKNTTSLLGSLTKYLKDELGMKNADIARLLNKDYKSTWAAYKKVK